MKSYKIAVIGLGALGSEVCRRLAEERYGDVLLVDPDHLERRNVELSSIYQNIFCVLQEEAFQHFKSKLMVDFISREHTLRWRQLTREIADVGMSDLANCDVLLSCTDSALARVETAYLSRILDIPMIDGGVMSDGVAEGRASLFSSAPGSACYFCGISEVRRAELLAYAASTSLGCGGLRVTPAMSGATTAVRMVAGSMLSILGQMQSASKIPAVSFSYRIKELASKDWSYEKLEHPLSDSCPWHSIHDGEWVALNEDRPICEVIQQEGMMLQLAWPQCLQSRCRRCGYRSAPNRRVAWVRRKMVCDQCGAPEAMEPMEAVATIGLEDNSARYTPRQLGMPHGHLYLLRHSFVPASSAPRFPASGSRKALDGPVA